MIDNLSVEYLIERGLKFVCLESDGSITFECPTCAAEGHPGKRAMLYQNGTISCARFASAGPDANREHVKPVKETLGLSGQGQESVFISKTLLDGRLTLEVSPAARSKQRVAARNCSSMLHLDEIALIKDAERKKFVRVLQKIPALQLEEAGTREVTAAMIELAERFNSVSAIVDSEEADSNKKHVSFIALEDGRVVEQIASGFAVYNSKSKKVTFCGSVEFDGVTYYPVKDHFISDDGLKLPEMLKEYGDEQTLDAEIEAYIKKHIDLSPRDLKLSARYVRFTYVFDKVLELPYLRPIGPRGNGKSRYVAAVGGACYRPVTVVDPTAAALFRIVDRYHPTLIVDEANFQEGSDDTRELIRILNAGYQRLAKIPRVEGDNREIQLFDPFGPKLIASLKTLGSQAFESRCIRIEMAVTSRRDIRFRLSPELLRDQAEMRAKLMLWRIRNWHIDLEYLLEQAENELREADIEARYVQVSIPLYAMLGDDPLLKRDFSAMLQKRDAADAEERRDSLDGQLVEAIYSLLVDVDESDQAAIKTQDGVTSPEEGKPCELLIVDFVAEIINKELPEKRQHDARWIGKQINKLGLQTQRINRRSSLHRKKSAVVFDPIKFEKLFALYGMPVSGILNRATSGQPDNTSDVNDLNWPDEKESEAEEQATSGQDKYKEENEIDDRPDVVRSDSQETGECTTAEGVFTRLVSLDTETEPFDPKRGITHRNARMIGLALCYDGERADYHTDRDSWPMMMPDTEQTVIFHNAKFDLSVLERAGLSLPEQWEDTMIAAHLLDENGKQGLKDLAQELLGVESPKTFVEADRMRLLDPQVFEEYARNDARFTFRLWQQFEDRIDKERLRQVYEIEKALVPVGMDMERAGMKIDLDLLDTLKVEVATESKRVKDEIFQMAGCHFDINSPAKVAAIVYDKLGVPSSKQTTGGQRSVDKEALEEVRGYHPAVDAILRYREIDKLAGTFINVLPEHADANGRIHPEFKALGAITGRFSCSDPNVQQIPSRSELGKRLRQAFIAEPGNRLVVADYSQMELRVLAHYSRDPLLVEAYTSEQETDLHTLTASRMFKRDVESISKRERTVAKMINFGIAYGITPLGLFNRLRPEGHNVTEGECKRFIEDYFKTYPGVRNFLDKVREGIKKFGFVYDLYGRRRRLKGATAREIRQAQNFIIQATAADITKDAMVRLHKALPEGAQLIAMVHDELIVECRTEIAEQVRELMVDVMSQSPVGFSIPLKVEAHTGSNWGETK